MNPDNLYINPDIQSIISLYEWVSEKNDLIILVGNRIRAQHNDLDIINKLHRAVSIVYALIINSYRHGVNLFSKEENFELLTELRLTLSANESQPGNIEAIYSTFKENKALLCDYMLTIKDTLNKDLNEGTKNLGEVFQKCRYQLNNFRQILGGGQHLQNEFNLHFIILRILKSLQHHELSSVCSKILELYNTWKENLERYKYNFPDYEGEWFYIFARFIQEEALLWANKNQNFKFSPSQYWNNILTPEGKLSLLNRFVEVKKVELSEKTPARIHTEIKEKAVDPFLCASSNPPVRMEDPVTAPDGYSYDRSFLMQYYEQGNKCCPKDSSIPLPNPNRLVTNYILKNLMEGKPTEPFFDVVFHIHNGKRLDKMLQIDPNKTIGDLKKTLCNAMKYSFPTTEMMFRICDKEWKDNVLIKNTPIAMQKAGIGVHVFIRDAFKKKPLLTSNELTPTSDEFISAVRQDISLPRIFSPNFFNLPKDLEENKNYPNDADFKVKNEF